MKATVNPIKELTPVTMTERGNITKIYGRAYVAGVLPFKVKFTLLTLLILWFLLRRLLCFWFCFSCVLDYFSSLSLICRYTIFFVIFLKIQSLLIN